MKKLLLLTLLWLCAVPIWAQTQLYEGGTLIFYKSPVAISSNKITLNNVSASLENNILKIWNSEGTVLNSQQFFTESVPLELLLDKGASSANLNVTSTSDHPIGFKYNSTEFSFNLTISDSGVIGIKYKSSGDQFLAVNGNNQTNPIVQFDLQGLTPYDPNPSVKLENIDYNYANSFTATLTTKNIDNPANVNVKYGLSSSSLTPVTEITVSESNIVAKFDLDLSSVGRGKEFDVYLEAEYNGDPFEFAPSKFTKPNGTMSYIEADYPSGITISNISKTGDDKTTCGVVGNYLNSDDERTLTIANFASVLELKFSVKEDGSVKMIGSSTYYPGTTNYIYNIDSLNYRLSGNIENTSSTTSKLTLNTWGTTPTGNTFYKVFFDTEITFDFAIPGLPVTTNLSIGDVTVSDVTYNSAKITVSDVEYPGFEAEDVNVYVSVNPKDTPPEKYSVVTPEGNTATLYESDLAPGTEYTVTVYAQATAGEITIKTDTITTGFTTAPEPKSITIGEVTASEVSMTSAKISFPVTTKGLGESPELTFYYNLGTNANGEKIVSGEQGRDANNNYFFYLSNLTPGTAYTVTVFATAEEDQVVSNKDKSASFTTPEPATLTVGQPNVTFAQVDNTVTATLSGTVTASPTVSDFSGYQIMYSVQPQVGTYLFYNASIASNGSYSFSVAGMKPGTEYTINMTPSTTTTPSKVCGTELQTKFTTPAASTPTGPVNATGNMTYTGGSYPVSAVYDAEQSKLTLTGVGGKTNRSIVFNVGDDGSLVSNTNQIYDWDYDYDPDDETRGDSYPVYYSDKSTTSSYNFTVTGTAENEGANCVLKLGDIGAYNTNYGSFVASWNNTVITLNDLHLAIETVPSISITDVNMEKKESGYEFTVTLTSDNITEDITVSYTVTPTIENQPEVTKKTDGTYTFTLPTSSLTAGTKYTITVSAKSGDIEADPVSVIFDTESSSSEDFKTVTLTGNYSKITTGNGYFTFDNNDSNPFGTKFSLTYYSPGGTGEYQKLGLYNAGVYTQEGDKYVFVVAGSIDGAGVVKPITPSSKVDTDRNQLVFSQETGLFENSLCEKSGNSYQAMPNAVICVVECTMKPDPDNNNAPVYTVEDVRSVYKFLGGRYGKSLTEKTEFPPFSGYYNYIDFVSGTAYSWTLKLQEVEDFHYGDVETLVESVDAADEDARYFTLQGVEIRNPEAGTLCIKVSGNKATKVIIR